MLSPRLLSATAALAATGLARGATPLGRYGIGAGKIGVSGLSSGGFMANRLSVAHRQGGHAHANGSGRNTGPWNVFAATALKQTGPNYRVIGTCP